MNRRVLLFGIAAGAAGLLAGCRNSVKGRYATKNNPLIGQQVIEFKAGNKANMETGFNTIEVDYEVAGAEVKLKTPMGTMVGKLQKDGCIDFGITGTYCKSAQ
jgi:hypothetical protein